MSDTTDTPTDDVGVEMLAVIREGNRLRRQGGTIRERLDYAARRDVLTARIQREDDAAMGGAA